MRAEIRRISILQWCIHLPRCTDLLLTFFEFAIHNAWDFAHNSFGFTFREDEDIINDHNNNLTNVTVHAKAVVVRIDVQVDIPVDGAVNPGKSILCHV